MQSLIYLDSNATTQVAPEAVAAMLPFFEKVYGNPSSLHAKGMEVAKHVEHARDQVGNLLGCQSEELVFTGCGSESNALAIRGVADLLPPTRRHLVTTAVEHSAVKSNLEFLTKHGFTLSVLGVDRDGMISLDELEQVVSDRTGLVSIMYANNETGVIFPIEQIGTIVKAKGAVFHVDAVQAVGKIPIALTHSTIDLLSLAGHKFHAPKGVGALFVRKGVALQPQLLGGHQEHGRRAGTEAVPSLIALGMAAELAQHNLPAMDTQVRARRDRFEHWVLGNIADTRVNGDRQARLPNTSNISFRNLEGENILLALSTIGICVSAGAACMSGSLEPSRVLKEMQVPHDYILGAIRFSLSRYTTDEEISQTLAKLPVACEKLRKISRSSP